jgi:hypothetical protein
MPRKCFQNVSVTTEVRSLALEVSTVESKIGGASSAA